LSAGGVAQWLRFVQVIVGKGGLGLDLRSTHDDGLRITFQVEKTIRHKPNTASILIYNLHPADEKKVLDEFEDVILNVGYQNRAPTADELSTNPSLYGARVVFRGNIKRAFGWWDHESGDRVVEIQAADGDKDYRNAVVNTTLAAGTTEADEVAAVLRAMSNTKPGVAHVKSKKRLRGKVISGAAREILHPIAKNNDAHWSIQDGVLQIVKSDEVLPGEAIVINEETGLIGAPEISDKGVRVTCLLNPLIAINGKVLLNNNNIKIQQQQMYTTGPKLKAKNLVRLSPDGVYKVYKVVHEGDSRGEDATTVSECVAIGDSIPPQGSKKGMARL
jgi:hypothetical protein